MRRGRVGTLDRLDPSSLLTILSWPPSLIFLSFLIFFFYLLNPLVASVSAPAPSNPAKPPPNTATTPGPPTSALDGPPQAPNPPVEIPPVPPPPPQLPASAAPTGTGPAPYGNPAQGECNPVGEAHPLPCTPSILPPPACAHPLACRHVVWQLALLIDGSEIVKFQCEGSEAEWRE